MDTIKFYRQRFYLEKIVYAKGATTIHITEELKKSLRYQMVVLLGSSGEKAFYNLYGVTSSVVSPEFEEAWVIKKSKEAHEEIETYSKKEEYIIKAFIWYLCDHGFAVSEAMCDCLGPKMLRAFHSSYGSLGFAEFRKSLKSIPYIKRDSGIKKIYDRPRYSVWSLAHDLCKTKDMMIYTDPEFVGKYHRISVKKSIDAVSVLDKWTRLTGISGNRTRANLSLVVDSYVKVKIPENSFGVESGEKEFKTVKSFSLIVDGMLNMKGIGIKTKDTKLIGKLKRLGILEPMLIEDEYIVNLTDLPVATKKMSPEPIQLGSSEYRVRKDEVILTYLKKLYYKKSKKLSSLPKKLEDTVEKDDATKFLESLGIFGEYYYPDKSKTESRGSYKALELIGVIKEIPSDVYPNIRNFINTSYCKNEAIYKILTDPEVRKFDSMSLSDLKSEINKYSKARETEIRYLRDLKFRAIMSKSLSKLERKSKKFETLGVTVSWYLSNSDIEV